MKTPYLSLLAFLIVMGFSNLAFSVENYIDGKDEQHDQSLQAVEDLINRLGQRTRRGNLQKIESASPTAENGLKQVVLPLLKRKDEPRMGRESHAQELGFDTGTKDAEVRKTPFPIFEVTLNDLRHFSPGKEPTNLLTFTHQLLFPVEVDTQVKSSITVRFVPATPGEAEQKETGIGWRLTRWGLPNLIHRLTTEYDRLKLQKPAFLVSIPALNRYFLGYEENTIVKLVPLFKNDHLTVGESYPAQDVFKWLSKEAKNMDESPR